MMLSVNAERAHKPHVISFSPAPFIVKYGGKHGEKRERENSRISGKYW